MTQIKKLLPFIKKYRTRFLMGFLFVVVANLCSTAVPRVVGHSVDLIREEYFQMSDIWLQLFYLFLLTAGSGLFMFLTRNTIIVGSRLIEYDLRKEFLISIESQDMQFFQKRSSGDLMAHTTNDIQAAREFIGPALMYGANTITTFAFALFFMLSLNVKITLFVLLPLPLIAISVYFLGKKVHKSFRAVQEQFSEMTHQAQESFSGIRIIKTYLRQENEQRKFNSISKDYLNKNMKLAKYQTGMVPIILTLVGVSQLAVIGFGGWEVINGNASLGDLTQFFIYLNLLIWPIAAIGWITNVVQRAAASIERLFVILDSKPKILNQNESTGKKIDGEITFKDVSFRFEDDLPNVLNGIDLKIEKGMTLGIVGGIGSGKTAMVNLIPRLYDVTEGKLLIDGINISDHAIDDLRGQISTVPQEPFLFSMTIAENIKFSNPDASEEEVIEMSKLADLHDDVLSFEDGYQTMLGERGITLSGGQKQRLAIARALLKKPKILILDDALSSVDTETENKIMVNLRQFMKDRTSIIISHRISTVHNADMIITLDSGHIIEQGTHEELLEKKGKYFELWYKQQIEENLQQL
jgi:ATP-binding cassette subfamily B multidrug efflux pump